MLSSTFAGKTRSDAQKATLLERRGALLHQIGKWRELQAIHMPGVIDASASEPEREKAESIRLWLPSGLDTAERDTLCSGVVITSERELRFGQLHDALDDLRRARRIRYGLTIFHKIQLGGEGQKTETKSRAVVHTVQERIDRAVQRYRVARDALLKLDPSGSWQDLYLNLDDCDNRGPGKEPEEMRTSDGQYFLSWIWRSNSNTTTGDPTLIISPDEVNEDMRAEWAQCAARVDRWEEEVILLQEEMRRVVHFLEWKSKDWISRVDSRASVVTPEVRSGLSAYARKQGSVFHNLATRFCQRWHSTLVSLSLPHPWATEFLENHGVPLTNPDFKKRKSERQEHQPPKSPVIPPCTEPIATNPVPTAPIPIDPETSNNADESSINPETSNDDDESSDSDSDTNSSEFDESDESEYEPDGWWQ